MSQRGPYGTRPWPERPARGLAARERSEQEREATGLSGPAVLNPRTSSGSASGASVEQFLVELDVLACR